MRDYQNYACPNCGRLATLPWRAVWCLHHSDNFQAHPPDHWEMDWTRMVKVIKVETEDPIDVPWVVVEHQNTYGWVTDDWHEALPGTPDRSWSMRVVSEPMSQEEAQREAGRRPRRPGWPRHMQGFHAYPIDLTEDMHS